MTKNEAQDDKKWGVGLLKIEAAIRRSPPILPIHRAYRTNTLRLSYFPYPYSVGLSAYVSSMTVAIGSG
jgi:hypothetical protein